MLQGFALVESIGFKNVMTYVLILMTWTAASGNWFTQQILYPDRNSCAVMAEMVNSVKPTR